MRPANLHYYYYMYYYYYIAFPAEERHRPVVSTKLYCLVTEAHVCEQLAQGRYMKVGRPRFELVTS